jgi:hypothetical protein
MQRPGGVTDVFALLFDPKAPMLFVVGGVLLAVMGNAAYDLALVWLGCGFSALLIVLLVSLVLLGLVVFALYSVLRRKKRPVELGPEEAAERRRGLVLFLSKGEGKADEEALKHHLSVLEHVWLIATDEARQGNKVDRLTLACRKQDVAVATLDLAKPQDAGESCRLVRRALRDAEKKGLVPGNLYVDVTGCLRPAAIEATKACLEAGHDLEYVLAKYDANGRVVPGTAQVVRVSG